MDYGDWLIRFCTSVSWRILRHGMDEQLMDHLSEAQQVAARGAEETWRRFLLGQLPHPGRYEQHIVAWLGPLKDGPQDDLPDNFNRYLMRGTGVDVFTTGGGAAFTCAKMGRFSVFGTLAPARDRWEGTKVHLSGRLPCLRLVFPGFLRGYLKVQALKLRAAERAIPTHHRARIEEELRRNLSRFHNSDQYAVMMHDAEAFGIGALLNSPEHD